MNRLVKCARKIAKQRGYTNLVRGLQSREVLQQKFQAELQEFEEANNLVELMHEVCDLLYYQACICFLFPWYRKIFFPYRKYRKQLARKLRFSPQQLQKIAEEKYKFRSSGKKDKAHEFALIRQILKI